MTRFQCWVTVFVTDKSPVLEAHGIKLKRRVTHDGGVLVCFTATRVQIQTVPPLRKKDEALKYPLLSCGFRVPGAHKSF